MFQGIEKDEGMERQEKKMEREQTRLKTEEIIYFVNDLETIVKVSEKRKLRKGRRKKWITRRRKQQC